MPGEVKNPLEVLQVRIRDLSSELEKITVKAISKISGEQKNTSRKKSRSTGADNIKTIEIRLSLPAALRFPNRSDIKRLLRPVSMRDRAIISTGVFIILIGGYAFFSGNSPKKAFTADTPAKASTPKLQRGNPPFPAVLPAGKSVSALGGWARISPPSSAPVYAFIDHVGKIQLNVSEQPLPANFKANPGAKIAELAQNFNAGDKFSAAGTTVYVATQSNGSQYVILGLSKLLVLISSTSALTNNQWAAYVSSLH